MRRRKFLAASGGALSAAALSNRLIAQEHHHHAAHRIFATPAEAMKSPREKLLYTVGNHVLTKVNKPDFLATVDVDPDSKTYSQVIHHLPMPKVGDELHHYGWNACANCHGEKARRYLIVPGLRSSRIHIIDTIDPRQPKLVKVIEPEEVIKSTKLTAPHTVHCRADGTIMISMLGNEKLGGPGGFMQLDEDFNIVDNWTDDLDGMHYNYDFWYQPRHNVMVSSEWGAPSTTRPGFNLEDVKAGKYGQHIHFWDWEKKTIVQSVDLGGEKGMIPLEVRFHHNPDSTHGFVGAALSSVMWHWEKTNDGKWKVEDVIRIDPVETEGWPFPVPGLVTDLLISMDDRWLYFVNWLHGDVRQYDIANPSQPKLKGQLWLGGLIGKEKPKFNGKPVTGGPQMLQLSLDGKRLYVTNSLFSSWDNQFYPDIAERGSYLLQVDCDTEKGGLTLNEDFFVDFGAGPHGPARAHEVRFPHGDCTSDIWV